MSRLSGYFLFPWLAVLFLVLVSGCASPTTTSPPTFAYVTPAPSPVASPTPVLVHVEASALPAAAVGHIARLDLLDVVPVWECEGKRPVQTGDIWLFAKVAFFRLPTSPQDVVLDLNAVEIRDLYDRSYPLHWDALKACGFDFPDLPFFLTRETSGGEALLSFPIPSSIVANRNSIHLRWDARLVDGSAVERLEIEFVPPSLPPSPTPKTTPAPKMPG